MAAAFIANRHGLNDAGWDWAGVARAQKSATRLLAERDEGMETTDGHPGYMDKFRGMMSSASPFGPPGRVEVSPFVCMRSSLTPTDASYAHETPPTAHSPSPLVRTKRYPCDAEAKEFHSLGRCVGTNAFSHRVPSHGRARDPGLC